jgi:hypothetical protein
MGAVVGGGRPQLTGQLDAGPFAELVRVHPQPEPRGLSREEHGPSLVGVERAPLDEHVDPLRVRSRRRQHRTGDQADVARRVVGVLGRYDMGAEVGGLVGEVRGDRQRPRLVRRGEPVPRLDLDRRGPLPPHLRDQPGHVRGQLLVGGLPGGGDRGTDAARAVGPAGHPRGELLGPVPGEHQVGMGVDEPGDHRPTAQLERGVGRGRVPAGADPGEPAALDHHGGVEQLADRRAVRRVVGHQRTDPGQQQ